jgi:hypothetical protein
MVGLSLLMQSDVKQSPRRRQCSFILSQSWLEQAIRDLVSAHEAARCSRSAPEALTFPDDEELQKRGILQAPLGVDYRVCSDNFVASIDSGPFLASSSEAACTYLLILNFGP